MPISNRTYRRPNRRRLFVEGSRALSEFASLIPATPFLYQAPRGDSHPVLVMPGFGGSDNSTSVLRGYLNSIGYRAYPWNLGTNRGPGMPDLLANLAGRLHEIHEAAGRKKVSIVGWSLGGVYARVLAHHHPEQVRQVVTLGSPFRIGPRSHDSPVRILAGEPLPDVPSTAVFSKTDSVVPWQIATQPETSIADNVEVYASHIGLGFNPSVLYATADRLANRDGEWQPWRRDGWKLMVYGPADLSEDGPAADAEARQQRTPR